jgi:methylated-DNA-protein-cysteine methyltransferase related protein
LRVRRDLEELADELEDSGDEDFAEAVYRLTKSIPKGQVATYGQIATYIHSPRWARAVGTALRNLPRERSKEVPWHRVINASGKISARGDVERPSVQQRLLEKEGVVFDKAGKTNLILFGWTGPAPDRRQKR